MTISPRARAVCGSAAAAILLAACLSDVVLPGPPDGIASLTIVTPDLTVPILTRLQLQVDAIDHSGGVVHDGFRWTTSKPGMSVSETGEVRAGRIGAWWIRVESERTGAPFDSVRITVVPRDTVFWVTPEGIHVGDLTGRSRVLVAEPAEYLAVRPYGETLVYRSGDQTVLLQRDGSRETFGFPTLAAPPTQFAGLSDRFGSVYFSAARPGEAQRVYFAVVSTDELVPIGPPGSEAPAPGPGGRPLAYVDSQSRALILHDSADPPGLAVAPMAHSARWSWDGDRLAYTDDSPGLAIVDAAGAGLVRIGSTLLYPDLAWSPDSRYVIGVTRTTGPTDGEMLLFDIEGREAYPLGWHGRWPQWSWEFAPLP